MNIQTGEKYIIQHRNPSKFLEKIIILEATQMTLLIDFESEKYNKRILKTDFESRYKIIEKLEK